MRSFADKEPGFQAADSLVFDGTLFDEFKSKPAAP